MSFKNHTEITRSRKQICLKMEQFPFIIALSFTLIGLLLLYSNKMHWGLINDTIVGLFGIERDYISIIFGIIIGFGVYTLVIFVIGLRSRRILHNPVNVILGNLIIIIFLIFFKVIVLVNMRVRLDYIWFSAGQLHFWMYLAILALFTLAIAVLLLKMPNFLKKTSNLKEFNSKLHPKIAFISILISLVIGIYFLISLLFVFPINYVFWNNIILLHLRNEGFEFLYYFFGGGLAGWMVYLLFLKKIKIEKLPKLKRVLIKLGILFFPAFIFLFIALIGLVIQTKYGYGFQAMYPLILGAILLSIPLSFYSLKFLRISLSFHFITKKRFTMKNKNLRPFGILSLLLFSMFSVFLVPSIVTPPNVDAPAVTTLQYLNNTYVPFQNGIVYPAFDYQPDISENGTRKFYSLNGDWKFDFQNSGIWFGSDLSLRPRSAEVLSNMATGWEAIDFNDSHWENITVPSSFNRMDHPIESYRDAQGICLYRRTFSLTDLGISEAHLLANNISIFLKFLAVNYITDTWLDGEYIGYHEGGFNSFCFDVTELLQKKGGISHLLAIRVDTGGWNTKLFTKLVPGFADWFNYAGLVQNVYFEVTPRAHVVRADIQVTKLTPKSNSSRNGSVDINIDVCINIPKSAPINHSGLASLSISISPLNFPNQSSMFNDAYWHYVNKSIEAQPDILGGAIQRNILTKGIQETDYAIYRFTLSLDNVSFWTNKQPSLYVLEVNFSISGISSPFFDRFLSQIGFRELTVEGTKLFLNRAPVFLVGNNIHQECPGMGRTVTPERIRDDLLLLKNISTNIIRCHYTLNRLYYLYGDRLGLAFWEEIPVYWFNDVTILETMIRGTAKSIFLEMVYRDFNRPSIFFWSVANEPWSEDLLAKYLKDFRDLQELIDPTRILGYACAPSQTHIPPYNDLEMITGNMQDEISYLSSDYPNKPILITEYGAPIDERTEFFLRNSHVIGFIHWIGIAYFSNYNLDFNYYWSGGMFSKDRIPQGSVPYMQELYENLTLNNP